MIKSVLSPALVALLSTIAFAAETEPLVGRASVIDGDTLDIHGEHIRINGVDAPESAQLCKDSKGKVYRCGAVAATALAEFLEASSPTRCEFVTRDRYGRFVGNCYRADGKSVAGYLVRNGLALDWPQYSAGKYADEQARAKAERLGLWSGTFTAPWEWRAEQRTKREITGSLFPTECKIKGNISRKGARIYHLPGQRDYAKTRVNERTGERWFCSEGEAMAAGWKPARR
jgi:endonuclease YncB( thermonuclease family)